MALRYSAAYPERIDHPVLLSPGPQPLGLDFTDAQQQAAMRRRSAEPLGRRRAGACPGGFSERARAVQAGFYAPQPGAGHYPWLDDPAWFTARLLAFLD